MTRKFLENFSGDQVGAGRGARGDGRGGGGRGRRGAARPARPCSQERAAGGLQARGRAAHALVPCRSLDTTRRKAEGAPELHPRARLALRRRTGRKSSRARGAQRQPASRAACVNSHVYLTPTAQGTPHPTPPRSASWHAASACRATTRDRPATATAGPTVRWRSSLPSTFRWRSQFFRWGVEAGVGRERLPLPQKPCAPCCSHCSAFCAHERMPGTQGALPHCRRQPECPLRAAAAALLMPVAPHRAPVCSVAARANSRALCMLLVAARLADDGSAVHGQQAAGALGPQVRARQRRPAGVGSQQMQALLQGAVVAQSASLVLPSLSLPQCPEHALG